MISPLSTRAQPRDNWRVGSGAEITGDECQVTRLDRDVRPRADGEPQVGLSQSRCIVDAVSDHRDPLALRLERFDLTGLVRWQHLREHLVHAKLRSHSVRDRTSITGDHDHIDVVSTQLVDRRLRFRSDDIGHGQHREHRLLVGKIDRGAAGLRGALCRGAKLGPRFERQ